MKKFQAFENPQVAAIFDSYPEQIKEKLLFVRQLIFETAKETANVGQVQETIKWGQPSYLTIKPKSGATLRIDQTKSEGQFAIYVNCQTTLIDTFRELYHDKLNFEGNRAILFNVVDKFPIDEVNHCISISLTYHLNKKAKEKDSLF